MRQEPLDNDIPKHNSKKKKLTVAQLTYQLEQLEKKQRQRRKEYHSNFFVRYYNDQIEAVKKQLEETKAENRNSAQ